MPPFCNPLAFGVEKSPILRFEDFKAVAVIPLEFIGFRELLKIERDIPKEFYSGNALDIGSIFDIR
jgi:hypothetical protein